MVTRLRQRLFPARAVVIPEMNPTTVAAPPTSRNLRFHAGIAEFLLITRLRARSQPKLSADIRERASQVIFVTCRNWFVAPDDQAAATRCTPL